MIKILHIEIEDTCDACPYCQWSQIAHEYYCDNEDTPHDATVQNMIERIPTWCPLPNKET